MDRRTTARLHAINRRFYALHGPEFDRTRQAPWPGWQRLLHRFALPRRSQVGVLDVACGNARLASFLAPRLDSRLSYVGVDASLPLLAAAARRPQAQHLVGLDVLSGELTALRSPGFTLVAVFGLLHHVAGIERRRALLAQLARCVEPGGRLWLSFWQFGASSRFGDRRIEWQEHNATAAEAIDVDQLEPGDWLLRWGPEPPDGQPAPRRYCHDSDRGEAERLVSDLDLDVDDLFEEDGQSGNLNLYLSLRRPER